MKRTAECVAFVLLAAYVCGCGAGEPLRVSDVQVGRSLNSDNSIGSHTTSFKPGDTMYASVLTDGSGSATITARWTYAGRVVNETAQKVSYTGHAATEFHIRPSGDFPTGEYVLEILFNGEPVETRNLRVR